MFFMDIGGKNYSWGGINFLFFVVCFVLKVFMKYDLIVICLYFVFFCVGLLCVNCMFLLDSLYKCFNEFLYLLYEIMFCKVSKFFFGI